MTYSLKTGQIEVLIIPNYDPINSSPSNAYYIWQYDVLIRNNQRYSIKISSRLLNVVHANGIVCRVDGAGIFDSAPIILPRETFEYSSYAALGTNNGIIYGHFVARNIDSNEEFEINLPPFSLHISFDRIHGCRAN